MQQQFSLFDSNTPFSAKPQTIAKPRGKFSDYVVYVDESGDHGMQNLEETYPVFVLAFCVFHKRYYCEKVVPALQYFKFSNFGHDSVVLHEHEIRKEKGAFTFFQNRQHKSSFMAELSNIIDSSNFVLISCVIDKAALRAKAGKIHTIWRWDFA